MMRLKRNLPRHLITPRKRNREEIEAGPHMRINGRMDQPVSLKCPNCASPFKTGDFDTERGLLKCGYCHALMTMPSSADSARTGGFHPRAAVPLPPRLKVDDSAGRLEISYRWFTPAILFLVFFCIAWDGFLILWYTIALSQKGMWIMTVFPLLHVAVGLGLTYFTLASLLNTTRVTVEQGKVRVRHGPMPWAGNKDFERGNISQLYCKERVCHSKNGTSQSYEIWMTTTAGTSEKFLTTVLNEDQALYIEQRVERALGITDRAVPGELAR